jgi:hypothetical protein
MISDRILKQTCTIRALTGQSFDSVGCPVSSTYTIGVTGVPCYFTETTYEMKDGKEPIKNVYLFYCNYSSISAIDTSFKVFANSKVFDILNVDSTFDNKHWECIIKEIGI